MSCSNTPRDTYSSCYKDFNLIFYNFCDAFGEIKRMVLPPDLSKDTRRNQFGLRHKPATSRFVDDCSYQLRHTAALRLGADCQWRNKVVQYSNKSVNAASKDHICIIRTHVVLHSRTHKQLCPRCLFKKPCSPAS